MNHLVVVAAGLLGGVVGFILCLTVALWVASAAGVSEREGAHGYLGFVAGLSGGLMAMIACMVVTLYWQGTTNVGSIAASCAIALGTIAAIAGCGAVLYWISIPKHLSPNGAPPVMHFEVRSAVEAIADPKRLKANLSCDSSERPEVQLADASQSAEDGMNVVMGQVELYYRASWRLLSLELPDGRTVLFKIRYPADPTKSAQYRQWSQWHAADDIQPATPAGPSDVDPFEIRYRIEFWKET